MSGDSTANWVGTLDVTTPRRDTQIGISQVIDGIEAKWKEISIPHGGTPGSLTSIPLDLSPNVTEALMVILVTSLPIVIQMASSDANVPGPMNFGLKGMTIMTLYPSEGITILSAYNPDNTNDAVLEVGIVALGNPSDTPTFWNPQ